MIENSVFVTSGANKAMFAERAGMNVVNGNVAKAAAAREDLLDCALDLPLIGDIHYTYGSGRKILVPILASANKAEGGLVQWHTEHPEREALLHFADTMLALTFPNGARIAVKKPQLPEDLGEIANLLLLGADAGAVANYVTSVTRIKTTDPQAVRHTVTDVSLGKLDRSVCPTVYEHVVSNFGATGGVREVPFFQRCIAGKGGIRTVSTTYAETGRKVLENGLVIPTGLVEEVGVSFGVSRERALGNLALGYLTRGFKPKL